MLKDRKNRVARAVAAGIGLGIAAGLLAALMRRRGAGAVTEEGPHAEKKPGLAARILARIPGRVKFAAGVGATKEGTRAGYRELRERIEERYD